MFQCNCSLLQRSVRLSKNGFDFSHLYACLLRWAIPLVKSTLPIQKSSLLNSTHPSRKSSLLNWTRTTPSPSPISTSAANLFQLVVGDIFQRGSPKCAYLHFQKSSLFSLPLLWRERREDGYVIFLERLICFFSYSVSRQHYCVRRSIITALQSALDPCFFGALNYVL